MNVINYTRGTERLVQDSKDFIRSVTCAFHVRKHNAIWVPNYIEVWEVIKYVSDLFLHGLHIYHLFFFFPVPTYERYFDTLEIVGPTTGT